LAVRARFMFIFINIYRTADYESRQTKYASFVKKENRPMFAARDICANGKIYSGRKPTSFEEAKGKRSVRAIIV
jgi:hypothetical protein